MPIREWATDYYLGEFLGERGEGTSFRTSGDGFAAEVLRRSRLRAFAAGREIFETTLEEAIRSSLEGGLPPGLIRNFEIDFSSELGGRFPNVGINALGSVREVKDEVVAWQLRAFKGSGAREGANAGLIWRWAYDLPEGGVLSGLNLFLDYQTYEEDGFLRWSAGGEFRSSWVDVFANHYVPITESSTREEGARSIGRYTAGGSNVEFAAHSPDLPWLSVVGGYYLWEGEFGREDEQGFRGGLRFSSPNIPLTWEILYQEGEEEGSEIGGSLAYRHEFGRVYKGLSSGGSFAPTDYFYAPVNREYTQRIYDVTLSSSGFWGLAGIGPASGTVSVFGVGVNDEIVDNGQSGEARGVIVYNRLSGAPAGAQGRERVYDQPGSFLLLPQSGNITLETINSTATVIFGGDNQDVSGTLRVGSTVVLAENEYRATLRMGVAELTVRGDFILTGPDGSGVAPVGSDMTGISMDVNQSGETNVAVLNGSYRGVDSNGNMGPVLNCDTPVAELPSGFVRRCPIVASISPSAGSASSPHRVTASFSSAVTIGSIGATGGGDDNFSYTCNCPSDVNLNNADIVLDAQTASSSSTLTATITVNDGYAQGTDPVVLTFYFRVVTVEFPAINIDINTSVDGGGRTAADRYMTDRRSAVWALSATGGAGGPYTFTIDDTANFAISGSNLVFAEDNGRPALPTAGEYQLVVTAADANTAVPPVGITLYFDIAKAPDVQAVLFANEEFSNDNADITVTVVEAGGGLEVAVMEDRATAVFGANIAAGIDVYIASISALIDGADENASLEGEFIGDHADMFGFDDATGLVSVIQIGNADFPDSPTIYQATLSVNITDNNGTPSDSADDITEFSLIPLQVELVQVPQISAEFRIVEEGVLVGTAGQVIAPSSAANPTQVTVSWFGLPDNSAENPRVVAATIAFVSEGYGNISGTDENAGGDNFNELVYRSGGGEGHRLEVTRDVDGFIQEMTSLATNPDTANISWTGEIVISDNPSDAERAQNWNNEDRTPDVALTLAIAVSDDRYDSGIVYPLITDPEATSLLPSGRGACTAASACTTGNRSARIADISARGGAQGIFASGEHVAHTNFRYSIVGSDSPFEMEDQYVIFANRRLPAQGSYQPVVLVEDVVSHSSQSARITLHVDVGAPELGLLTLTPNSSAFDRGTRRVVQDGFDIGVSIQVNQLGAADDRALAFVGRPNDFDGAVSYPRSGQDGLLYNEFGELLIHSSYTLTYGEEVGEATINISLLITPNDGSPAFSEHFVALFTVTPVPPSGTLTFTGNQFSSPSIEGRPYGLLVAGDADQAINAALASAVGSGNPGLSVRYAPAGVTYTWALQGEGSSPEWSLNADGSVGFNAGIINADPRYNGGRRGIAGDYITDIIGHGVCTRFIAIGTPSDSLVAPLTVSVTVIIAESTQLASTSTGIGENNFCIEQEGDFSAALSLIASAGGGSPQSPYVVPENFTGAEQDFAGVVFSGGGVFLQASGRMQVFLLEDDAPFDVNYDTGPLSFDLRWKNTAFPTGTNAATATVIVDDIATWNAAYTLTLHFVRDNQTFRSLGFESAHVNLDADGSENRPLSGIRPSAVVGTLSGAGGNSPLAIVLSGGDTDEFELTSAGNRSAVLSYSPSAYPPPQTVSVVIGASDGTNDRSYTLYMTPEVGAPDGDGGVTIGVETANLLFAANDLPVATADTMGNLETAVSSISIVSPFYAGLNVDLTWQLSTLTVGVSPEFDVASDGQLMLNGQMLADNFYPDSDGIRRQGAYGTIALDGTARNESPADNGICHRIVAVGTPSVSLPAGDEREVAPVTVTTFLWTASSYDTSEVNYAEVCSDPAAEPGVNVSHTPSGGGAGTAEDPYILNPSNSLDRITWLGVELSSGSGRVGDGSTIFRLHDNSTVDFTLPYGFETNEFAELRPRNFTSLLGTITATLFVEDRLSFNAAAERVVVFENGTQIPTTRVVMDGNVSGVRGIYLPGTVHRIQEFINNINKNRIDDTSFIETPQISVPLYNAFNVPYEWVVIDELTSPHLTLGVHAVGDATVTVKAVQEAFEDPYLHTGLSDWRHECHQLVAEARPTGDANPFFLNRSDRNVRISIRMHPRDGRGQRPTPNYIMCYHSGDVATATVTTGSFPNFQVTMRVDRQIEFAPIAVNIDMGLSGGGTHDDPYIIPWEGSTEPRMGVLGTIHVNGGFTGQGGWHPAEFGEMVSYAGFDFGYHSVYGVAVREGLPGVTVTVSDTYHTPALLNQTYTPLGLNRLNTAADVEARSQIPVPGFRDASNDDVASSIFGERMTVVYHIQDMQTWTPPISLTLVFQSGQEEALMGVDLALHQADSATITGLPGNPYQVTSWVARPAASGGVTVRYIGEVGTISPDNDSATNLTFAVVDGDANKWTLDFAKNERDVSVRYIHTTGGFPTAGAPEVVTVEMWNPNFPETSNRHSVTIAAMFSETIDLTAWVAANDINNTFYPLVTEINSEMVTVYMMPHRWDSIRNFLQFGRHPSGSATNGFRYTAEPFAGLFLGVPAFEGLTVTWEALEGTGPLLTVRGALEAQMQYASDHDLRNHPNVGAVVAEGNMTTQYRGQGSELPGKGTPGHGICSQVVGRAIGSNASGSLASEPITVRVLYLGPFYNPQGVFGSNFLDVLCRDDDAVFEMDVQTTLTLSNNGPPGSHNNPYLYSNDDSGVIVLATISVRGGVIGRNSTVALNNGVPPASYRTHLRRQENYTINYGSGNSMQLVSNNSRITYEVTGQSINADNNHRSERLIIRYNQDEHPTGNDAPVRIMVVPFIDDRNDYNLRFDEPIFFSTEEEYNASSPSTSVE